MIRLAHAALLVATVCSTGCGFHLHNADDEATARKALDTFQAADVGQFVANERAVVQAAHERDLAAMRRNVLARRDALIVTALSEDRTAVAQIAAVNGRLFELTKQPITSRIYSLPELSRDVMLARDAYLVTISPRPDIRPPSLPPTSEDRAAAERAGGAILADFNTYSEVAKLYTDALEELRKVGDGEIGALNAKLDAVDALQKDIKNKADAAKAELDTAVKAYKAIVSAAERPSKELEEARKRLEEALKKFEVVVDKLKDEAPANLQDLLAEVRLKRLKVAEAQITEFLEGFTKQTQGKTEEEKKEGESKASAAGRAAAIMVNADETIRESDTRAKLVPLIFEQGRLTIEIARLQRKLERGRSRIALLERQREYAISEAMRLTDVRNQFTRTHQADLPNETVAQLLDPRYARKVNPGDPNDNRTEDEAAISTRRANVVHGILVLAESAGIDRLRRAEAEVALLTLDHDEALDASEYALEMWQYAIATPLDELVNYHASGLKPEDISNLIQAASLVGIAIGVN